MALHPPYELPLLRSSVPTVQRTRYAEEIRANQALMEDSVNQCPNPGAETGVGWWLAENATLALETTTVHSGTGAFKLTATATGVQMTLRSPRMVALPGEVWYTSVWVRAGTGSDGNTGAVICTFRDAAGNSLSATQQLFTWDDAAWDDKLLDEFFIAPAATASVTFGYCVTASAVVAGDIVYLDDIDIVRKGRVMAANFQTDDEGNRIVVQGADSRNISSDTVIKFISDNDVYDESDFTAFPRLESTYYGAMSIIGGEHVANPGTPAEILFDPSSNLVGGTIGPALTVIADELEMFGGAGAPSSAVWNMYGLFDGEVDIGSGKLIDIRAHGSGADININANDDINLTYQNIFANGTEIPLVAMANRRELRVRRVANQSINSGGGGAQISWDTEDTDTHGFIAVTSATITIPSGLDGIWGITVMLDADNVLTGRCFFDITVTSSVTGVSRLHRTGIISGEDAGSGTVITRMDAGDSFVVSAFHSTGVARNFVGWLELCQLFTVT